jgi:hypothetical protein
MLPTAAISIVFALAIYFKVGKAILLGQRAITRVRQIAAENYESKRALTIDEARLKLTKSSQSM